MTKPNEYAVNPADIGQEMPVAKPALLSITTPDEHRGSLVFENGKFSFIGDADESARLFIDALGHMFDTKQREMADQLADLQHAANIQAELDNVKRVRGWVEVDMCMFCGCTRSLEEITAAGGMSCCPERRMKKTLVPEGYKDRK